MPHPHTRLAMRPLPLLALALGLWLLLWLSLADAQPPAAASGPAASPLTEIEMFVGESRVLPAPGVARIAVGNGQLLTAAALDGQEVLLFANGPGTSSLFIWHEDGQHQRLKVHILAGDTGRIAREIAGFLATIPGARASIIGDKVVVEGDQLGNVDIARIELLSKQYPQMVNFINPMGFERMVTLEVRVAEFPVTALKELGLQWQTLGGAAIGGIWAPSRRGLATDWQATLPGETPAIVRPGDPSRSPIPPSGLHWASHLNLGIGATLQAMAQEGKTVILASPQLSARSGSRASFLAGGEIPYSVPGSEGPVIVFKPYGVKLDILPQVDALGHIRATIETEVSSIDGAVSTQFGPALLTRKTSTEFNVRSGETIVLSGLMQREQTQNVSKVPGLGDLPLVGALFRTQKFLHKQTELVVFVTPSVQPSDTRVPDARIRQTEQRLERLWQAPPAQTPQEAPHAAH
jgi:pilus assembly protein CpaC